MSSESGSKIKRVIDAHDLDISGTELERRWSDHEQSLRDLSFEINKEILDTCLKHNGVIFDEDVVRTLTRKMMDNDAVLTEFDLKERGIDVDSLLEDFVSYQSVYNYLTKTRGVEYSSEHRSPSDYASGINSLRGRTESVASQAISSLRTRGYISSPEPFVDVDIGAVCPHCDARSEITIWIQRGCCPDCGK